MGTSASVQRVKTKKFCKNDATLASLKPGDLVKFRRHAYFHWAVYIGNDQVVHVSEQNQDGRGPVKSLVGASLDLSKVNVSIQNFWAVAKTDQAYKANERDEDWSPLPSEEIVERATAYQGEVRYNLLTRNCEHFAKWCRYDRFKSDQVDRFRLHKHELFKKAVLTAAGATASTLFALHKTKEKIKSRISGDRHAGQQSMGHQVWPDPNNNNKTSVADAVENKDKTDTGSDEETVSESEDGGRELMAVITLPGEVSPSHVRYKAAKNLESF